MGGKRKLQVIQHDLLTKSLLWDFFFNPVTFFCEDKKKMQIQFSVFLWASDVISVSVFSTNLGLNRNHFSLLKVLLVTALLPKFCSCSHSLCAKLLTATGKEKAQICKRELFEILNILFLITLLHCCQFLASLDYSLFPSKCYFQGMHPTGKFGK